MSDKILLNHKTFQNLTHQLLAGLDSRSKDVITRRYGLQTGTAETLESIGREYGITRERVRQIESQAKKALSHNLDTIAPAAEVLDRIFALHGGILTETYIVQLVAEQLGGSVLETVIAFYLEISPDYTFVTTNEYFAPHWRQPRYVKPIAEEVIRIGRAVLHESQHPQGEGAFLEHIQGQLSEKVSTAAIVTWLNASRHIRKNPFGEWGLSGWAETTPRGVGDKAYAVLRRHGHPEHFRRVAELINEAGFDRKRANAQTVHNELIKDKRFVLVGRGLYGLTEWGYIPGTVADVLESCLKKSKQPLTREELIEQVLAQRLVKKNTILLSLQDQSRFVKIAENRYTLKEKS